ncbi:hypothetical protein TNCV_2802321 [Trichonephila clavipes]|nr:hypothetical protein TNCV_2802321 [Trichonephila clavipes]
MSPKTVEKRRKLSWPVYLMLPKGRYKTGITSDEVLFHLLFTTGKTKIQYTSRKKRRKDVTVLQKVMVYKIVTEDLSFKKLCSRWVPRVLTAEHKEKRFVILLDFLIRYEEEGEDMLSRIIYWR